MKIAVITVNKAGDEIATKLMEKYEIELFSKSSCKEFKIKDAAENAFIKDTPIVFITSTGIAVRAIAPFIRSKTTDPAVIVIDSCSKYVISLLSGHLGGANKLTEEIAILLKAIPIITTATDNMGIKAPDIIAKENNLVIDSLKAAKDIAALLVEGRDVGFLEDEETIKLPKGYVDYNKPWQGLVYVTDKTFEEKKDFYLTDKKYLKLIKRDIILGIGCKKNYDENEMKQKVLNVLIKLNIDKRAVKTIATVDIKKEEKAIIELSKELKCDMVTYSVEDLKKVAYKYQGSEFVEKTIGVKAVCEPCVELSLGKLITGKLNLEGMTLCIGRI